ncbi:hypothetical protein ISS96_00595 [Candidatus Bathyarchaeota archaeon]|nr:hypothetical protein [Candidatus Bathyarchaeota archaeon]
MKVSASLRLMLRDLNTAKAVRAAIFPEILSYKSTQTDISLNLEGECLILEIETYSVSSLRALLNSYLRWMLCAEETIGIVADRTESLPD